ncbi:DUF1279 super [Rhodotorula kratochvilovae]
MQRVPQLRTALPRTLLPAARTFASSSPSALQPLLRAALPPRGPPALLPHPSRVHSRGLKVPPPPPAQADTASSSSGTHSNSSHSSSSGSSSSSSSRSADPDDTSKVPLTQRIKYLFRKHGWTALVVYLLLSAADFGACFLVISAVGADRVRDAEDWTLDHLGWRRKTDGPDGHEAGKWRRAVDGFRERRAAQAAAHPSGADAHPSPAGATAVAERASTEDVVQAEKAGRSAYSAYATTAVLAYAVHKTLLLPFRVGVTVAVTPRVVRTLQGWGWRVGMAAGAPPTAKAAAGAAGKAASH